MLFDPVSALAPNARDASAHADNGWLFEVEAEVRAP
jgi:hypothetical protein